MTRNYGTPKVLHIQETDCDGNKRIVRYYREDTIDYFVSNVERLLKKVREEADGKEKQHGSLGIQQHREYQ